jgi:hypothetical protein
MSCHVLHTQNTGTATVILRTRVHHTLCWQPDDKSYVPMSEFPIGV